jgi:uncharacterized iron-regulated protein
MHEKLFRWAEYTDLRIIAISETRTKLQATDRCAASTACYTSFAHNNVFQTYIKYMWNKKTEEESSNKAYKHQQGVQIFTDTNIYFKLKKTHIFTSIPFGRTTLFKEYPQQGTTITDIS